MIPILSLRLSQLGQILEKIGLAGFIVTNPINIFYLSGFKGVSPTEREAILVFAKSKATLVTARFYQHEARKLTSNSLKTKIVNERNQILDCAKTLLKNAKKVGFEGESLKFAEYHFFKRVLQKCVF